jgi:flavin-dependent dehydrogenase
MKSLAKKDNLVGSQVGDSAVNDFELVILGGGLAGLTLAIQLKNQVPSLNIAILEKNSFPVAEAAHKVGEATVELSTYYLSQVLGQLEHLENNQLPKLGLRYYFNVNESSPHSLDYKLEFGTRLFPKTPSFQLDRGILENHLKDVCESLGVTVMDSAKVKGVAVGENGAEHVVEYMAKGEQVVARLYCKWLVDASSRASILKRELGLLEDSPHQASSAWFRISEKICVDDWYENAEWASYHTEENSRWYSTNHFMGAGYWVWFIPLASGATSIGIVTDNNYHALNEYNSIEKAISWLEKYEPLCAAKIIPHLDKILDFRAVKNFSHSATQVYSSFTLQAATT